MTTKNIFGFVTPLSIQDGGTGNSVSIGYIGKAGTAGFGVGICPAANLPSGMTPMSGCYDPTNVNYGNYQYVDGSVMCFIPKFYYLVGTGSNGLAVNVVDIKGTAQFSSTFQASDAGYALHRAFIDGGAEQAGFFFDKYKCSQVAKGTGYVGASILNGLPLSTASTHNPMWLSQIPWTADTVIALNTFRRPTVANGYAYECTARAGDFKTDPATEPTWPTTIGNTVVDDQITWTCRAYVGLTACGSNAYFEAIKAAHARDGVDGAENATSIFFVASQFQRAALALLSMAHGQACTSTVNCAWYHATYNYPKGCNNNALRDQDDATVLYVTDGYSNCGKTGSGDPFAKTTHNGQACGVADLNGLMWETSLGVTCIAPAAAAIGGMSQAAACEITWTAHGLVDNDFVMILAITQADWSGCKDKLWQITKTGDNTFTIPFNSSAFGTAYDAGTDPGTVTKGTFYVAKQATYMKSFTSGNAAATDHWGATGVAAMMDAFAPPFKPSGAFGQRMGSGTNQVLSEAVSGAGWLLAGMGMPKDSGGIDPTGTDLFGKDYFYQYIQNELCPLSCANWYNTSYAGVWYLNWNNTRTHSHYYVGWRCACYPV